MDDKEILILCLPSGEQLLALVQERQGAYLCSNVVQIMSEPDPASGQTRMGFMPYLPFADPDGGVAVPTNMAIMAVPSQELRQFYSEKFGLIITPPTPKIIL